MIVKNEGFRREEQDAKDDTRKHDAKLRQTAVIDEMQVSKTKAEAEKAKRDALLEIQEKESAFLTAQLEDEQKKLNQQLSVKKEEQSLTVQLLVAEASALKEKMNAVSPHLIRALQGFGDKVVLERLGHAMSPFGMINLVKGKSLMQSVRRLVSGSPLEDSLPDSQYDYDDTTPGNGKQKQPRL